MLLLTENPMEQVIKPIRIIAWGNRGRQDDGSALLLAERLSRRYACHGSDVIVQQYHQLGPELVHDLDNCRLVIFVDAHVTQQGDVPMVEQLVPAESGAALDTHHCSPEWLLGLTAALGLFVPEAMMIGIPGHQWEFGDELSEPTRRAIDRAEQFIEQIIAERVDVAA